MNEIDKREDALYKHVADLIEQSRQHVKRAIDAAMVYTYYGIRKIAYNKLIRSALQIQFKKCLQCRLNSICLKTLMQDKLNDWMAYYEENKKLTEQ